MITFFIYPTKRVSRFKLNVFESQKLHDILRIWVSTGGPNSVGVRSTWVSFSRYKLKTNFISNRIVNFDSWYVRRLNIPPKWKVFEDAFVTTQKLSYCEKFCFIPFWKDQQMLNSCDELQCGARGVLYIVATPLVWSGCPEFSQVNEQKKKIPRFFFFSVGNTCIFPIVSSR